MNNWKKKKFGDVAQIVTGNTPSTQKPEYFGGEIPFVTPLELGGINPITESKTTLTTLGAAQARILPRESVMVCCIGSLGKVGIAGRKVVTNQQINSLIFDEAKVFPRYGYQYCRTLKPYLEHIAPSTTLPIVNKSRFSAIEIPLPPLEEQRRIAEVLDKADALRQKRRLALQKLDTLLQSVFLEMFGDPVKNPKGLPRTVVNNVAMHVSSGSTPLGGSSTYLSEGVIFVRSQNVLMNAFDFSDVAFISDEVHRSMKRTWVKNGDVLFNITGASIGRVHHFEGADDSANVNQHVCIIRPDRKQIRSEFLSYQLSMPSYQASILGRNAGATRQAFNFEQIRRFQIILPSKPEQDRFVNTVRTVASLRERQRTASALVEANFSSIQEAAFKGDLFNSSMPSAGFEPENVRQRASN